jgi:hypothetical protein
VLALAAGLFVAGGCGDETLTPGDLGAPDAIVDLTVESVTDSSAVLTWTAPRDRDEALGASNYDLRYTRAELLPSNWADATPLEGEPSPGSPGSPQRFTAHRLQAETAYQFALRSGDAQGRWSGLSNVVTATPTWTPRSEAELIAKLARAYARRKPRMFASLFPAPEDSVQYFYFLNEPAGANWDRTEELRIHRRMFTPLDLTPGETPVPQDLWLASIDIQLEPQTAWTERPDLYRSQANPAGLNPRRWKVTDAIYHTYVLFLLQGFTGYQVNGRANFVVVEDRSKLLGQDHKFLLYRWEDLGSIQADVVAVAAATWTQVKSLYN